jgi:hypothetical protein
VGTTRSAPIVLNDDVLSKSLGVIVHTAVAPT